MNKISGVAEAPDYISYVWVVESIRKFAEFNWIQRTWDQEKWREIECKSFNHEYTVNTLKMSLIINKRYNFLIFFLEKYLLRSSSSKLYLYARCKWKLHQFLYIPNLCLFKARVRVYRWTLTFLIECHHDVRSWTDVSSNNIFLTWPM